MLGEWNVKRVLSKVNYALHTDAVHDSIIPKMDVECEKTYIYANEANMLNLALWPCMARQMAGNKSPVRKERFEYTRYGKYQRIGCFGKSRIV